MKTHGRGKMFGVALDASDDPWNLQLKLASMWARQQGRNFHSEPYETMVQELGMRSTYIEPAGSVPIPSWLWPRPRPSDLPFVTQESMQEFVDGGGLLDVAHQVKNFVASQILPQLPIMVGVDHSATGGVVSALSEALGPDRLTVVALDHHFDGIPLSVRMRPSLESDLVPPPAGGAPRAESGGSGYCCGDFWAYLIQAGVLHPEHLLLLGVADYPIEQTGPEWATFRKTYLEFGERGCSFFPLAAFKGAYKRRLRHFLREKITTPYVYVSLDVDVGAGRCVHAARYMDGLGIERKALLDTAEILAEGSRCGAFRLVGLDVMEFNMHLLGMETPAGLKDTTVETAWAFVEVLTANGEGTALS
jgi:arginase family enzyme